MKVLDLYSGIGGNRKLWQDVEVTAVEMNPKIAKIYQDFFPQDKVVVGDAHQYLLDHFKEFDFIWSSPPCPTHSRLRKSLSIAAGAKPIYPDIKLYEEILFLGGYFKGKYCVENVISWYKPLIPPQALQRHYFWTNFYISQRKFEKDQIRIVGGRNMEEKERIKVTQNHLGISLDKYKMSNKLVLLRNCVYPPLGNHILKESKNNEQIKLFEVGL